MQSSIKMIKANKVFGGESVAKIDTQIDLAKETELAFDEGAGETEINLAQKKSKALIDQAKLEVEQLKANAKQEMESMRQATYEEAQQVGQEAGYSAGFEKGLADGVAQADAQNKQAKASIMAMIQKAQEEIKLYQQTKKEEMIQLATHMAEKIVHDQIDQSDEGLLKLAKSYFYQLDKDEEFVSIATHPTQQAFIESQLHKVEAISPNTRFLVFADPSLEEYGLVIESSKAVIDLQIKKQLESMMNEFEEMERTVDA